MCRSVSHRGGGEEEWGESLSVYVYNMSSKQVILLLGWSFRADPMQSELVWKPSNRSSCTVCYACRSGYCGADLFGFVRFNLHTNSLISKRYLGEIKKSMAVHQQFFCSHHYICVTQRVHFGLRFLKCTLIKSFHIESKIMKITTMVFEAVFVIASNFF